MVISSRLTEDGVRSLISISGFIEPVYIQDVNSLSLLNCITEIIKGYDEINFPKQILIQIGKEYKININNFIEIREEQGNRPKPLYISTALQIGLLNNENIPNLIPCLLTNKYNAHSARFLKQWILNPPTHEMADHMRGIII